jgi:hypothetical protein
MKGMPPLELRIDGEPGSYHAVIVMRCKHCGKTSEHAADATALDKGFDCPHCPPHMGSHVGLDGDELQRILAHLDEVNGKS